jgi:hypothetical protein
MTSFDFEIAEFVRAPRPLPVPEAAWRLTSVGRFVIIEWPSAMATTAAS